MGIYRQVTIETPAIKAQPFKTKYKRVKMSYVKKRTRSRPRARKRSRSRSKSRRRARYMESPRMQIGFTPGKGACKTVTTNSNDEYTNIVNVRFDTDTLNSANISDCARGSDIDQRERDVCLCAGFHLTGMAVNRLDDVPLVFHYAVVSPRDDSAVQTADFFRGYNDDRGRDFSATSLSGMDVYKNPINTDKFTVFFHKRIWLRYQGVAAPAGGDSPFISESKSGIQCFDKWIPINRQLRYGDTINCQTPVFLVWWAGYPQKAKATAAVADAFTMTYRAIMHFREPE